MPSCLGLFIQNNLIKYAKVSKERDIKKVETFGVKFFDDSDMNSTIKQIVEETYSFKSPISINLTGESYNYFDMFSLLSKSDLQKAIKTEFETYCAEEGINSNVFETRYAAVPNIYDSKKLRIIYVSDNKIELNKRIQLLPDNKVSAVAPISVAITNIQQFEQKQNAIIVNIEDITTITTIYDQKIYDIQQFEEGSQEILEKINLRENSYSKSYEKCKNTTIYTSEGKELQEGEMSLLEDVMPTLYSIVQKVNAIINNQTEKIDKVYITGTAALINNIDLYFQEFIDQAKCEILRPDFIKNTRDISIKDYIEVNSAIALALMGLGEGIEVMNFRNKSFKERLPDWMKIDVNIDIPLKGKIKNDLGEKFDNIERGIFRGVYSLAILLGVYSAFSLMLDNQLLQKQDEVEGRISNIQQQIAMAQQDDTQIKAKINSYTSLITRLQEKNEKESDILSSRNAIPNFLNQIMYIIPENVQLTSIQNTTGKHIEIQAQSDRYEQLGIFKAKLQSEEILTDVISTAGQKDGDAVTVKIEGDLP